ncbi:hypothetical protein [Acinetobacter beijerinckii]|uniref:hypothetical protein n=1 Tax=Acinetobacter beijerinckii TaxID=262668 RepID=UPI002405A934|nr:hypothetical protein [Acinetobacter beijerinckii]
MNKLIIIFIPLCFTGCESIKKHRAPYEIPNVTIQTSQNIKGDILQSQHDRYLYAYKNALVAEGYTVKLDEINKKTGLQKITISDLKLVTEDVSEKRIKANHHLFNEGAIYAKSICNNFFAQVDVSKSNREHTRKQSNIIGGLLSAALGLTQSSTQAISAVGVSFSGVDSMFSAYDNSFVISPTLGLVQQAALDKMDLFYKSVEKDDLDQVSKVMNALADYSAPCTQVGLQSIVDNSIKQSTNQPTASNGYNSGQIISKAYETIDQQNKDMEKLRKDVDKYKIQLEQLIKLNKQINQGVVVDE